MERIHIAVLGAGRMGCGIAQVFAAAGHPVSLYDTQPAALAAAPATIAAMSRALGQEERVGSLVFTGDLAAAVRPAGLVIEAAPENLALKRELFQRVEALAGEQALLATNTSAIAIGEISEGMAAAARLCGMHFWNPPHLVRLVEVVQADATADTTIQQAMSLLESIGMSPVHVRRDIPGFIGNRLQHALKREAIALVAAGVCDAATLDKVVKEGFGSRLGVIGPLEQSDLVGVDLTYAIHRYLNADLDNTPGAHPYLESLVKDGKLGMKTGEGFYTWTDERGREVKARMDEFLARQAREKLSGQSS
ncbi:MAG: 3-hydroxyacyl-CoA dehydrogenase NAD-binding domain-containing protein [Pigmentiphaga sp.]|nr:3-hydroxyacyl-CoA dehydrogenase NAD-binding domain-containing protein [Pigmentiphaga sp.]